MRVRSDRILVIALLLVNILLLAQNWRLRNPRGSQPGPVYLQVGDALPEIVVSPPFGSDQTLEFSAGGPSRAFLYLSPTCPFCDLLMPYWQQFATAAAERGYEVWLLCGPEENLRDVQDYVRRNGLGRHHVGRIRDADREVYRLHATPITLLVDELGTVEFARVGTWSETEFDEALSSLPVSPASLRR